MENLSVTSKDWNTTLKKNKFNINETLKSLNIDINTQTLFILNKKSSKYKYACQVLNRKKNPHGGGAMYHIELGNTKYHCCSGCYTRHDMFQVDNFSSDEVILNDNGTDTVDPPSKPEKTKEQLEKQKELEKIKNDQKNITEKAKAEKQELKKKAAELKKVEKVKK